MTPVSNQELILCVRTYQANFTAQPLTCGNNSLHGSMEPKEIEGEVVLVCNECGYVQKRIPEPIMQIVERFKALMRAGMPML